MVRSRFSSLLTSSCTASASPIWLPIVWSGEKEVIGSWKIMPMRLPRIDMNSFERGESFARSTLPTALSLNWISPPVMCAVRGRMPRIACAVTDLPEPEFADQRHRASRPDAHRKPVDRLRPTRHGAELDRQVADIQQVAGDFGRIERFHVPMGPRNSRPCNDRKATLGGLGWALSHPQRGKLVNQYGRSWRLR